MFVTRYPEYKESGAFLLQHSEQTHDTDYNMRQTVERIKPVMDANTKFIISVLSNLKKTNLTSQQITALDLNEDD